MFCKKLKKEIANLKRIISFLKEENEFLIKSIELLEETNETLEKKLISKTIMLARRESDTTNFHSIEEKQVCKQDNQMKIEDFYKDTFF